VETILFKILINLLNNFISTFVTYSTLTNEFEILKGCYETKTIIILLLTVCRTSFLQFMDNKGIGVSLKEEFTMRQQ